MTNSAADLGMNESVNAYAPGTAEHRAYVFLTAKGQPATAAAVAGRVRDLLVKAERAPLRLARNEKWRAAAIAQAQLVADIIARERQRYGKGPTWLEVRACTKWGYLETAVKFAALREAGWITYTRETRSLDTGRVYRPREVK